MRFCTSIFFQRIMILFDVFFILLFLCCVLLLKNSLPKQQRFTDEQSQPETMTAHVDNLSYKIPNLKCCPTERNKKLK